MGKRTGGRQKISKKENDIYLNSINALEIFEYLKPHIIQFDNYPDILDACCNDGVLGRAVSKVLNNKCCVEFQDIKFKGESILDYEPYKKFDIIVCNPAWIPVTLPFLIYEKLLKLLKDNGVLFFLINNTFVYQGRDRAVNLRFHKYYFLPRYAFLSAGKPLLDCGIMVYHKSEIPIEAFYLRPFIDLTKVRRGSQINDFFREVK